MEFIFEVKTFISFLAYADKTVLIVRTKEGLKRLMKTITDNEEIIMNKSL